MAQPAITPAQKSFINNFMALNIEATSFVVVMSEKYNYYYDNNDCYDYDDVKLFDAILATRNNPMRNYVDEVVKARMDIMSSDRECAAFIAAMRHFIDNQPKQEAAPVAVPDSLLEEYTKAGCTFGRVKDTKYIQVVRVASPWGNIEFLYKGSKRGAFEEVKKQFDGFEKYWIYGNKIYLFFNAANKDIPGAEIDKAEIVAHCEQLDAAGLKAAAIDWAVRRTAFPQMPLQLPAITESAIYEAAARIRANYEQMKQQAAAVADFKIGDNVILGADAFGERKYAVACSVIGLHYSEKIGAFVYELKGEDGKEYASTAADMIAADTVSEEATPAANTLPAWLFVGAKVMTKGCYMLDNKLRRVWVDGERMIVEEINDDWVSLKRRENGLIVSSLSMKLEKAIKELSPAAGEDEQPKTIEKQPEATVEQPAPSPVKKAHTPRNQKSDMLQDWGEKIGGARKDEAQPHNNNGTTITAPAKKLKYGLTCRDKVNEEGEKITRWYLKVSPTRYSMSVYIDMPFVDISADIFRLGDESTEKAEKAFIEKYPNFDNYYKFDIFQIGFNKEYVVEAKRVKIRVATFDNLKAARDYMNTDRPAADLEAAKAARDPQTVKRAAALVVRNSINRPRVGTDYAQGRNITPEELATRFGLRAVEFGNWMNADDRQTSINECYNSFRALAELLGVPDEKIGRGTLAIAFGARGTGKANAHYEPARHVINLTRTRGAGSLAHEWAHSIDSADGQRHHLSKGFYFGGFSYRSKQAGSYWGSEHEQFARAFETAVHYALKDREVVDDYLVNIIEDCPVYPTWVENERIAPYVIEKIKAAL